MATVPGSSIRARLAIAPYFSPATTQIMRTLASGGLTADRVRVVIVRPPSDTLKDTTWTFTSDTLSVAMTVAAIPGSQLQANIEYRNADLVLFKGSAMVTVEALTATPTPPPPIGLIYVGPGATAARVTLGPTGGVYSTTAPIQLTYQVFDSTGGTLSGVSVTWAVSDATRATVSATGVLQFVGRRGPVVATATAPSGASGSASLSFLPPATRLVVVSGDGQSSGPSRVLPTPFVIELDAADGGPVPGQTVTFSTTAGSVTPVTATTDAAGRAQAVITLGSVVGTSTVTASGAGLSASITATAFNPTVGIGAGFASLRVTPAAVSIRVGDTVVFSAVQVNADGSTTAVTPSWATSLPGRVRIDGTGRAIAGDTGTVTVTATNAGIAGHATVTALPTPMLRAFGFTPTTVSGVTTTAQTTTVSVGLADQGSAGVSSMQVTFTAPNATTRSCSATFPTTGTRAAGTWTCSLPIAAGSPTGAWHATNLTVVGTITRTFSESALAGFGLTTLTVNP